MDLLPNRIVSNTLEILGNTQEAIFDESLGRVILNDYGFILNSNNEAKKLLGVDTQTLKRQTISSFIPELANKKLMMDGKLNPYLSFLSRVGHVFELVSSDGSSHPCLLFFHMIEVSGQNKLCLLINAVTQDYFPS